MPALILMLLLAAGTGAEEVGVPLRWSPDEGQVLKVDLKVRKRGRPWTTLPTWQPAASLFDRRGLDAEDFPEGIRDVLGSRLTRRLPLLFFLPGERIEIGDGALVLSAELPALHAGEMLMLTCTGLPRGRVALEGRFYRGANVKESRDHLQATFSPRPGLMVKSRLVAGGVELEMTLRYHTDPEGDLDGAVDSAVDRGVDWLRYALAGGQLPQSHTLGAGSLAMLAMLKCGVDPQDPVITAGFARLARLRIAETYAAAIYLMALEARYTPAEERDRAHEGRLFEVATRALPPQAMARALAATAFLLGTRPGRIERLSSPRREPAQGAVITGDDDINVARTGVYSYEYKGTGNFLWSYRQGVPCKVLRAHLIAVAVGKTRLWIPDEFPAYDASNTQYGILGLISARRCGIRVPPEVWETILLWWSLTQLEAGGWGYRHDQLRASYNMTTAGYVALLAARGGMGRQPPPPVRKRMVHALGLARETLDDMTPRTARNLGGNLYGAYGLERAGSLGAVEEFGCDWYRVGAVDILEAQKADGRWQASYDAVVDTSFALLFLARASTPIVVEEPKPRPVITEEAR